MFYIYIIFFYSRSNTKGYGTSKEYMVSKDPKEKKTNVGALLLYDWGTEIWNLDTEYNLLYDKSFPRV